MRFVLSAAVALGLVAPVTAADAPRRLLFVQISDYAYLNPLTHAAPGGPDRTRDAATRFAAALHVPTHKDNDQLFVLSDTDGPDSTLPTKGAIEKTLTKFAETSRAQDRVVVYIGAHAVAKDAKAFIVPIDGDTDSPETLVPVADVYARLGKLPCAQKVVIWDVCRRNPERARGRRDTGPMTPELFAALAAPPKGVQAVVSCSPGEHSLEYFTPVGPAGVFAGSAYLDALRQAAEDDRTDAKPGAPIPLDALHAEAAKHIDALAKLKGAKQTPAVRGAAPKDTAVFDPKAPAAKRFELPAIPAASAEAKAVFAELALPPVVGDDGILTRLPLPADALKGYAPDVSTEDIFKDVDKYPLRVTTLRALQAVRDVWPPERKGLGVLPAALTDAAKKPLADAQEPLAKALVRLELEVSELEALEPRRAKEPKRWQAHYDFALAELRLRTVLLSEFNRALGNARTETLPELDGGRGWRLVPSEKIGGRKDVRQMYDLAVEGFGRLMADHKGTPWAALAQRSRATLPGARWEAIPK
jgi:hypothetical protein